jgi:hypothetical protein
VTEKQVLDRASPPAQVSASLTGHSIPDSDGPIEGTCGHFIGVDGVDRLGTDALAVEARSDASVLDLSARFQIPDSYRTVRGSRDNTLAVLMEHKRGQLFRSLGEVGDFGVPGKMTNVLAGIHGQHVDGAAEVSHQKIASIGTKPDGIHGLVLWIPIQPAAILGLGIQE